jgi:hypothetical protein
MPHATVHDHGRAGVVTTPHVTELPLRLEPVEPDPFIVALPRAAGARARRADREQRERRIELVRRLLRVRRGEWAGGQARGTARRS